MFNPNELTPVKPNSRPTSDSDTIGKTRPDGNPKSHKDFKKVIQDIDPDGRTNDEPVASVDDRDEEAPSLFDLSAKKKTGKKEGTAFRSSLVTADKPFQAVDRLASNQENSADDFDSLLSSLQDTPLLQDDQTTYLIEQPDSDQLANLAIKDPSLLEEASREARLTNASQGRLRPDASISDGTGILSKEEKIKKAKAQGTFAQENVDLSYINPVQQRSSNDIQTNVGNIDTPSSRIDALKEIVDRITESIQTIQHTGRTETVVTLKHPPILDGSQINLTSFDSAKGEFNIAFTNLTGPAKEFLDRRLAGDALTMALEQKGFVVHIITTSTLQESPVIQTETGRFAQRDREDQSQQEQQEQQQNEEET